VAGPLPLVEPASTYGQEADIQRNIASAAQYNPATKLGLTAGDQPSKKATVGGPTSAQVAAEVKRGMGPKSGLEAEEFTPAAPVQPYNGPHPFASKGLAEHRSHLGRLTNLSPAMQEYLGQSRRQ
jgi:hypothetical protein